MARRILPLVIVALAGCLPDLPKDIHIEARFTDEETAILEEAIAEADRELGMELLGHSILTYKGRYDDPDGFTVEDFDDGIPTVYVLREDSPEYRWVENATDRGYGGYATLAEIHMVYRYLPPPDATEEQRLEMRGNFKGIMLHELGHFLGMAHNPEPGTIMCSSERCGSRPETYSLGDKRDFCFLYDCPAPPTE